MMWVKKSTISSSIGCSRLEQKKLRAGRCWLHLPGFDDIFQAISVAEVSGLRSKQ